MSKKGKKTGTIKWDTEDVIQAVVIADSFNFRFLPITMEKPRALLPLINRPLIDYTVEFLAVSGVQEIFVYCCAHADQIKAYLESSRWNKSTSPVKLRIIVSENCPSVGNALRDIDSQSLIRSHFVLVSGDLVANMELKEVIDQHKERCKVDKLAVMTSVYKKASPDHRTRSKEDNILIVTNARDKRLLYCAKPSVKKRLAIPVSIFEENSDIDLHYDVLDCHVTVCSPQVPQLFSDNFDYQTRYHFIRGILVSEEIMGNHIYTHFISDQYAARVSNLHTYDAINKDVIHRWVYPLVPDNAPGEKYSYGRHNIYLNTNVTLERGVVLQEDVVIGPGTCVGTDSQVTHSSIGRDCRVGKNVRIEGSYIWDNVVIEDNCEVSRCILCDGACVKANVRLQPGCILSYGVVVGPDFTVAAGTRLTTKHPTTSISDSGWGDDEETDTSKRKESIELVDTVPEEVGLEGRGFVWRPLQDQDEDSDDIRVEKWPFSEGSYAISESSRGASSPSHSPEPLLLDGEEGDADTMIFYNEILDSIRSGIAELVPNENTKLMINASKHAYNIPIQELPGLIIKAVLEGPVNTTLEQPGELLTYVKNAVSHLESLLQHYMKSTEAQANALQVAADCATQQQNIMAIFPKIVLLLYNAEIVEEAAIMQWHSELVVEPDPSPKKLEVLTAISPVIEWLKNAEEESSSSD